MNQDRNGHLDMKELNQLLEDMGRVSRAMNEYGKSRSSKRRKADPTVELWAVLLQS